jgi:hypothetical protein
MAVLNGAFLFAKITLMVFTLALVARSAGAADGEAKGELVVDGRRTPIAYAYAVPQRDGETLLILTDEPLSDKSIKDVFERIHQADDGKLHSVEMILDSKKTPISVSIRHEAIKTRGGGFSSSDHFEPKDSDPNTIAGRIYRTEPGEFFGVAYTFDATFTAPLWREPSPTLGGAAAAASPQAKVAIAFFKAGRAGDVAGVKKCVVSSRARDFDGPEGKKLMEVFQFAPDPARAKITRVDVEGDSAEVSFETVSRSSTETSTVKLQLEKGKWKVSP